MDYGSKLRIRWAAIGAAIAVTLGAGGIGVAGATLTSGERTSFVPINPCRLADTRPGDDTRGPRATPMGSNETYTVSAWGVVGDCDINNQATGFVLNVTSLNQTQPTFITIYPTGGTPPRTSSLNPFPGEPPTPNAVTVDLSASGQFDIYNLQGTVDVIVDVVGYYEDHNHDDLYYRKADVDNAIARVVSIATTTGTTPTIERVIPTSDTFTTPIPGRLMITKAFQSVSITCSTPAGINYFLTLDGLPIASSVQTTGHVPLAPAVFIGITGVVAPGTHTIGLAAECAGLPTPNAGSGLGNPGSANVLILN